MGTGGGTGFIGTALCNSLRHRGYDVLAVSRKPGPYRITWSDFSNKGLPDSTTAVVSLAGQNVLDPVRRWTEGFKQNVWASRVNTTKYLAEAIQHSSTKPKVFVSASGVGYYPPSQDEVFTEDGPGGDFDFLSRLCSDWESAADLPSDLGVRTVKIRTGVVLGRQGGMVQQLILPFYMGFGGPVGSGNQSMPWIHIQDIVGLFIHAIEKENVIGIVNGVAPQIITNREFATAFGKALRRPSFVPLPTFAVNLLFNEERGKIMTEGQKVTPKKALETGYSFKYPNITSAAKEFSKLIYADEQYI
ncbi:epimerase family protein SDR39U1-like isoform X2 [Homarus americanus]|uniref:epimerase family protein SDR39U1-like isoform X2 n=1 Tax=Homarus americanus TaxID=6706 RepID=UPI001C480059|nr:epimerase family protein SDR39U1-like isoform X2 [Homarus americanus]